MPTPRPSGAAPWDLEHDEFEVRLPRDKREAGLEALLDGLLAGDAERPDGGAPTPHRE